MRAPFVREVQLLTSARQEFRNSLIPFRPPCPPLIALYVRAAAALPAAPGTGRSAGDTEWGSGTRRDGATGHGDPRGAAARAPLRVAQAEIGALGGDIEGQAGGLRGAPGVAQQDVPPSPGWGWFAASHGCPGVPSAVAVACPVCHRGQPA